MVIKPNRRLKVISVAKELMADLLRSGGGAWAVTGRLRMITSNIPADLEIIAAEWNFAASAIDLVCSSASFEEVFAPFGTILKLPRFEVQLTLSVMTAEEASQHIEASKIHG
jgi:hypothetical protein